MVRWLSLAAYAALVSLSWFIFELSHVWPFNADRIPALRTLFCVLTLSATGIFLFSRWRLLPAALLLLTFATAAVLSNAAATLSYAISVGILALLVAVVNPMRRNIA